MKSLELEPTRWFISIFMSGVDLCGVLQVSCRATESCQRVQRRLKIFQSSLPDCGYGENVEDVQHGMLLEMRSLIYSRRSELLVLGSDDSCIVKSVSGLMLLSYPTPLRPFIHIVHHTSRSLTLLFALP